MLQHTEYFQISSVIWFMSLSKWFLLLETNKLSNASVNSWTSAITLYTVKPAPTGTLRSRTWFLQQDFRTPDDGPRKCSWGPTTPSNRRVTTIVPSGTYMGDFLSWQNTFLHLCAQCSSQSRWMETQLVYQLQVKIQKNTTIPWATLCDRLFYNYLWWDA